MSVIINETEYDSRELSEIYESSETLFAAKVTELIDEHYKVHKSYRDKCAANEEIWRNKNWLTKAKRNPDDPTPNSPVIHSTIESVLADVVDNYPDSIIRGVDGDDDFKALMLTELMRFTMQRAKHKRIFKRAVRAALKYGVGIIQTFWNIEMANGLGDVDYKAVDIRDFVWDTNAPSMQEGYFAARLDYMDARAFKKMFPKKEDDELDLETGDQPSNERAKEYSQRNSNTEKRDEQKKGMVEIINIYFKESVNRTATVGDKVTELGSHKTHIYAAQVAEGRVLAYKPKAYETNKFFFAAVPYLPLDTEPLGLSIIDLFISDADIINFIDQQFIKNVQASSVQRWFVSERAEVRNDELLNYNNPIINCAAANDDYIKEFTTQQFSSQVLAYREEKKEEIKEQSGQRDFNTGGTTGGVTAASAIESLRQTGAKRTRLFIDDEYAGHEDTTRHTAIVLKEHTSVKRTIRVSREAQEDIKKQFMLAQQAQQEQAQDGQMPQGPVEINGVTQVQGSKYEIDMKKFDLSDFDEDYDMEIISQKKTAATSALINQIVERLAQKGEIPIDLLVQLLEFEGKDKMLKIIKARMNTEERLAQTAQQMEEMQAQMEKMTKFIEDLTKEKDDLEDDVWDEKLKNAALIAKTAAKEGEGPETAEEALVALDQEREAAKQS